MTRSLADIRAEDSRVPDRLMDSYLAQAARDRRQLLSLVDELTQALKLAMDDTPGWYDAARTALARVRE